MTAQDMFGRSGDVLCLARRNVLCFFRDKSSVVFSLMAVLIVVMLYLLFLRNMLVDNAPDVEGAANMIDAWVLAGILGIIPVTASAGCLQTMVEDRANGRVRDLLVTPMSPARMAAGYVLSTFLVGLIMSAVTFAVCLAYLAATGCPMSAGGVAATAVLLIPSALSGSIIMYAITSFFRSPGAFSGFYTVVSVLIGFLTGIYMPMGVMPSAMQVAGTVVPATHLASLFRDSLGGESLDEVFGRADWDLGEYRENMGFDLDLGGFEFDAASSLVFVAVVTAAFFIIAVYRIKRSR